MLRITSIAIFVTGCAVDPSGLPGQNGDAEDAATDLFVPDLFVPDGPVTPDLGRDSGPDLGDVDMAMEVDLGVDMGPPDMGPPDMGPPDMGPPDMFVDGGCGMDEVCNALDDDCDGAIDEDPGGPRGENVCPDCTRAVSPGGVTYQICPFAATWIDARNLCRVSDYELASPETMTEDTFLDSALVGNWDYWIGLNDRGNAGVFEWEDRPSNRPLGAFDDWDTGVGEPSGGGGEDCVRIESSGRHWRDTVCRGPFSEAHAFACEAP